MCICVYVYMCICIYVYMYIYICIYLYTTQYSALELWARRLNEHKYAGICSQPFARRSELWGFPKSRGTLVGGVPAIRIICNLGSPYLGNYHM